LTNFSSKFVHKFHSAVLLGSLCTSVLRSVGSLNDGLDENKTWLVDT